MNYVRIFWKTFCTLAAGAVAAVQGLDILTGNGLRDNGTALGLGLLLAFVGAVGAVLHAYWGSPATTALQKALRAAAQAAEGLLATVILNSTADLFALPRVLIAGGSAIVLAFLFTYFQNNGTVSDTVGNVTATDA